MNDDLIILIYVWFDLQVEEKLKFVKSFSILINLYSKSMVMKSDEPIGTFLS